MRRPKIIAEFGEVYVLCWQKSKKLTAGMTVFVGAALYDEVHLTLEGHSTALEIFGLLKKVYSIIF